MVNANSSLSVTAAYVNHSISNYASHAAWNKLSNGQLDSYTMQDKSIILP